MREYKASKLRLVLFFTLAIFIGGAIGRIIMYRFIEGGLLFSTPSLLGSVAGIIAVMPLFLWLMVPAIERMNITITDDAISGPPPRGAKRVTIPLEKNRLGQIQKTKLVQEPVRP